MNTFKRYSERCPYRKEVQQGKLTNRGGANLRILSFGGMTDYRVGLTTVISLQTIYNPLILSVNINLKASTKWSAL